MNVSAIQLASGAAVPAIGLGTWKIEPAQTAALVHAAIESGYRHLDSACDYGNEPQTGEALRAAIDSGLVTRDQLWVTSKLWNTFHRPEHVRMALLKSLADLQLEYLDLYLIHFPVALRFVPIEKRYPPGWFYDPDAEHPRMEPDRVPLIETWQALEQLQQEGLVREIGVSNYGVSLLRDLLNQAARPPAMLQVEMHPYLTQEKLLRFCRESNIAVTAFSPLGAQSYFQLGMAGTDEAVLEHDTIQSIAAEHRRTPGQILLRWGVQRGTAVVAKTSHVPRLRENLAVFDFALSEQEMQRISDLNRNRRFNDPGDFCEAAFHTFFPIYE